MEAAKAESKALEAKFEDVFRDELRSLTEAIKNSSKSSDEALSTAQYVHSKSNLLFKILTSTAEIYPLNFPAYEG